MASLLHARLAFAVILATLPGILGITYKVVDNVPETRKHEYFNPVSDVSSEKKRMRLAVDFIRQSFQQDNPKYQKKITKMTLSIDIEMEEVSSNQINDKDAEIHISASHLKTEFDLRGEDSARTMFKAALYYEMTRILQWTGTADDPDSRALTEGIAAFMVLKRDYAPSDWAKKGDGERWDEKKDVTARFLQYCESYDLDFIAKLNAKLKDSYTEKAFSDLMGVKSIKDMWERYKKKYEQRDDDKGE